MSYLAINSDAAYWGQGVTDQEASRNAAKMGQVAKEAGMRQAEARGFPGVFDPDNTEVYVLDDNQEENEIDWFNWYCSEAKSGRTVKALAKMFKKDVLRS